MIYGNPTLVLVDDQTDRIGIRTVVLSQMIDPAKADPVPPQQDSGLVLVGTQKRKQGAIYRVTWTFEGANNGAAGVAFKDRGNSTDYGFEAGFAELSLKVHPEYSALLEKYEGVPDVDGGDILWPPTLSGSAGGGSALYTGGSAAETNPMFGIQSYFRMEGNYRFRYAAREINASLYAGVGYVASGLPGDAPSLKDERNWLTAAPVWRHRGNIYDITENYWLSGPGGWPEPVYRKGFVGRSRRSDPGIGNSP